MFRPRNVPFFGEDCQANAGFTVGFPHRLRTEALQVADHPGAGTAVLRRARIAGSRTGTGIAFWSYFIPPRPSKIRRPAAQARRRSRAQSPGGSGRICKFFAADFFDTAP